MLMDRLWEVRKRKESTGRLEMPYTEMRKRTSLVAQMAKNLPEMWETWVQSLGQGDPLEEGMGTTPVFLPGVFHGQRAWQATGHGVTKSQT